MKRAVFALALAACGGTPKSPTPELPVAPASAAGVEVPWAQLEGPVKTVTVKADDQTHVAAAKQMLAPELGKPIDRARLRDELAHVFDIKGIGDVSASAVQLADGVELVVTVTPAPALHALIAHEIGGGDVPLPGQLAAATGLPLDPNLLAAVVAQLRDQYLAKGYTDVQVGWTSSDAGKGQVDVAIAVNPGKATTITTIEFTGNAHAKKAELLKALAGTLAASSPWNSDLVDRAVLSLIAFYYDRGYINVAVDTPRPTGASAPATFSITEGDQFRLGKIEVTGVGPDDAKKYLAMVTAKKGDVFNRTVMQQGIIKIQEAAQTQVEPITSIDAKKKTIDLKLDVAKH
jgi:outer membrane protein insertion porin family